MRAQQLDGQEVKLVDAGKYDDAIPITERALAIREKFVGPDHVAVAQSLNHLGRIYLYKGDYVKAEPLFQRALAMREKLLGPNDIDIAQSLNNLASLYKIKGDYDKAEPLYQRAE